MNTGRKRKKDTLKNYYLTDVVEAFLFSNTLEERKQSLLKKLVEDSMWCTVSRGLKRTYTTTIQDML